MSKQKTSLTKKLAVAGIVAGSAYIAAGNFIIDKMLSKKGIKAAAEAGGPLSEDNSNCFYHSDEALAGIAFYREKVYKNLFTYNKYGECLHSIFYQNEKPSNVYAISCHGYTGDPSLNNCYARRFYEMGFNVLLPYLRGHGKSEHNYCTMGWLDRLDIIDWVNFIVDKNPDAKIILHGVSMGAVTVMNATGEDLPENVVCCIEDCGFTSLLDEYTYQLREFYKLPPDIILTLANSAVRRKLRFDLKENAPLKQVQKSKTPTLFIHGDKDDFVPFWMNYPLYQHAACEKERLIVEGAVHAASGYTHPEIYWDAITKFIDKYI